MGRRGCLQGASRSSPARRRGIARAIAEACAAEGKRIVVNGIAARDVSLG